MRSYVVIALGAFALSGCGSNAGGVAQETDVIENGRQVGEHLAQPLRPGLWELAETIGEVDQTAMPHADELEVEDDGARRASARTVCLPAAYADRPQSTFWAGSGNACDYDRFEMADGALASSLSCNATPGTLTIALDGRYDATHFDLATTTARRDTGADDITVNGRLEGHWLGECDADAS